MLECSPSEALTQPPTEAPEARIESGGDATVVGSKAHGTPDREADHKDQGTQQCSPETPLRNTGNRSPQRVETIKDTRSQRDRLGSESGITQNNTNTENL